MWPLHRPDWSPTHWLHGPLCAAQEAGIAGIAVASGGTENPRRPKSPSSPTRRGEPEGNGRTELEEVDGVSSCARWSAASRVGVVGVLLGVSSTDTAAARSRVRRLNPMVITVGMLLARSATSRPSGVPSPAMVMGESWVDGRSAARARRQLKEPSPT